MNFDQLPFIPGLKLSGLFYNQAVRPIMEAQFPQVPHAAARLDYGSDVLGFDTLQSRDHGWGPKVTLFLTQGDYDRYRQAISDVMADQLPTQIEGYPTNYDLPFSGEAGLEPIGHGPVRHWVAVVTLPAFFSEYLGIDPTCPLNDLDWLTLPEQHLGTIASGKVFHDGLHQLQDVCDRLRWYPRDIWLYLLANQWRRIDQEEPFMARCGDVGDDLGSRVVASRQIIEIMKLCFLMEQQYAPYYKWFGTAFQKLDCAPALAPILQAIFNSQSWVERETHLSEAYLLVMEIHNRLGLTPAIEPQISPFFNRPYQVPHTARFVDALHAQIQSAPVRHLPRDIGSVGQFVNSTDILSDPQVCQKLKSIYS